MARCGFCLREFKSSQSVRAHLRFCPSYQHRRTSPSAPPRTRRARTQDEDLERLFGAPVPARRTHPAPQDIAPKRAAPRPAPPRDPGWSREQIRQEVRRQWEALQDEERRHAAEQRSRAAEQRSIMQHLKLLVVDMFFTWEPIPPEARAEAKEQIERTFATLPILDLPPAERQQIATSVRERVFAQFRKTTTHNAAAVPLPPAVTTTFHSQPKEVTMPMHKVLTGYFICPRCEEEFELELVPEKEAVCEDCRVPLEELELDEDEDEEEDGDDDR
jgi:hypothetical protein